MRTTTALLAGAIAIALSGCYEGEVPGTTTRAPANTATPGNATSTLKLISSNPRQNEPSASLTGDITFTLSESLDPSSVGAETVQLTPAVAEAGHTGHSMGLGTASGLNSSLISLLGPDSNALNIELPITPGATVKGFVRPGADDRTIIFTPNNQLMPGMTYEIALHGLKTKNSGTVSDHFVPLTFTTAATVATRLVNKEGTIKTSVLKFEAGGHTVTRYPGEFPPGIEIPTTVVPDRIIKHDFTLPSATNFIANPAESVTYDPINAIKHYSANILNGGSTVLASAVFTDPGPNTNWGDADDLIHTYTETAGNQQKLFLGIQGASWPFSDRGDTTKLSLHEITVMVYDPINARSLQKHIWYTPKGLSDAEKQATAAPGVILPPSSGSVSNYHDYRYGTGVTNNGKLLARLRVYASPTGQAFSSTDVVRYCREYSYNEKGQLVKLVDYSYPTPPLVPGATETCPAANDRRLLFYTLNDYDLTTGATTKVIAKRPTVAKQAEIAATDVEMYIVYFEPR